MGFGRGRPSLISGRDSDIRGEMPGDDTENDFVFTVPPRDIPEPEGERSPSPEAPDIPIMDENDANQNNDWEHVEDVEPSIIEGSKYRAILPESFTDSISAGIDQIDNPNNPDQGVDITMQEGILQDVDTTVIAPARIARKKKVKLSKHGIAYPSLPAGVVKKLATTYARTGGNSKAKISKDTLDAIMQATDWFFAQVSDDLGTYAQHAGRKTIDESDVVTLMKRYVFSNDAANYVPNAVASITVTRLNIECIFFNCVTGFETEFI